MKCYNHHDRDAFAICMTCGKGLCLECIKESKGKTVCKNKCKSSKCKCLLITAAVVAVAIVASIIVLL